MRTIIHADLDAFYCSVEQRRNPTLRHKPFVVAGRADLRGVVATASYQARHYGIKAGTPTAKALQLCPELVVVSPDHTAYLSAAREVYDMLMQETSLVAQASIDEVYIDVSDGAQPPLSFAQHIQQRVAHELQLPLSCGIASNKLVAKAATDMGKKLARTGELPRAIYVVPHGQEAAFLAPLPVQTLCGIGPKTTQRLWDLGITTLGEIAWTRQSDIRATFTRRHAEELIRWAQGIDDSALEYDVQPKSFSHATTLMRDVAEPAVIESTLLTLSYDVARRLQHKQLRGWVVSCYVRWDDRHGVGRQSRLARATNLGDEIYARASHILAHLWDGKRLVRHVAVGVSQVGPYPQQLGFWDAEDDGRAEQAAIEIIDETEQFWGKPLSTHRMARGALRRFSRGLT